jgi:AraC-like DNA-binding protein
MDILTLAMEQRLREGFTGQEMYVIPRPTLAELRNHPLIRALYPTDIGWFPRARYHYRQRPQGAPEDHIILCISGHGYVEVEGQTHHLTRGHLLIIPRNTGHRYWAAEDRPWSTYWMHFRGQESDYYLDRMPEAGAPVSVDSASQREAARLFRDCLQTLEQGYTLSNMIYAAQSARHILSLLLFRNNAFPVPQQVEHRQQKIQSALDFMRDNVDKPLRLKAMAEQARLSVSHFSELFRTHTGHSPMAHYTQLKIRHACRLLDTTDKPVKTVAFETGYSDPYYFSRVFKKVMGQSPDKYRAIKKG